MLKHLFIYFCLGQFAIPAVVITTPKYAKTLGKQNEKLCPDPDIKYYLYSKNHSEAPEGVRVGPDKAASNLTQTAFNPDLPTKVIIHGYNSDIHLNVLVEIKKQYFLKTQDLNIFFVDWASLSGPSYPEAVENTRHVGACTAQLVERIKELGNEDIHLIGFSLGGQLTNFVANALRPYQVPRITGLEPAGPGFLTVDNENKLDKGDAKFVDVIHTNAFVQGTPEESGHVDFYVNGGVIQPGCWNEPSFFACNHHRAPQYFAESITSDLGFWGWWCPSYEDYILKRCPFRKPQILMGDKVDKNSKGVHLVTTNSVSPFAQGKSQVMTLEKFKKKNQRTYVGNFNYHQTSHQTLKLSH